MTIEVKKCDLNKKYKNLVANVCKQFFSDEDKVEAVGDGHYTIREDNVSHLSVFKWSNFGKNYYRVPNNLTDNFPIFASRKTENGSIRLALYIKEVNTIYRFRCHKILHAEVPVMTDSNLSEHIVSDTINASSLGSGAVNLSTTQQSLNTVGQCLAEITSRLEEETERDIEVQNANVTSQSLVDEIIAEILSCQEGVAPSPYSHDYWRWNGGFAGLEIGSSSGGLAYTDRSWGWRG